MAFDEHYKDDLPSYSSLEQELSTYYTAWYGDKKEPELSEQSHTFVTNHN